MSDKVEYSRLLLKRTNTAGVVPTIPPVSATTLNQFTPTDLFVGEMFANVEDDRLWIRTNTGLVELNTSGTTGSTVIPDLTQVLNSGNTTGGFDIVFTSGSKPVYQGLASGGTSQYLGLDASGNTIIVTGATGGSGTSGTSGTDGSAGTSGVNGSAGTSGVNGTSGTSGISGLGLFLPLSGGTVTGNTYFGITSGITLDQANSRLGIGTSNPQHTIEAFGTKSKITYEDTFGGVVQLSGDTYLPRYQVAGAPSVTKPLISMSMGVRTWDDTTFPGYGKVGDGHIYASNEMNGLNIINRQGSGTTEDYIRFYAGNDANGTTPDIHIQGSGATKGFVGINTVDPQTELHVSGMTTLDGRVYIKQITSGGSSTFLTIDSDTGQIYTGTGGASGTSGTSGINGTSGTDGSSGSSGVNGTSGTSGINGTSGVDGTSGSSGSSGISGTSGSSGVNGTSGTGFTWAGEWIYILEPYPLGSVVSYTGSSYLAITGAGGANTPPNDTTNWALMAEAGSNGTSGINGTNGSSGVDGTSGSSGVNGSSGTSGIGSSGTSGLSGVNGTSGTSGVDATFSGGSGNCITDLYVTNLHGCSPINVIDDIIFSGDVFIKNITSGGSSTYLTIDSDTGQLFTATGSTGGSGTSGTSGINGTSGTSGTGGGSSITGLHFGEPLIPGRLGMFTWGNNYQQVTYSFMNERIICYPVIPEQDVPYSALTIDQGTASATGNVAKIVIYDDNGSMYPGSKRYESTSIDLSQGGCCRIHNVLTTGTLSAGTVSWVGVAISGATTAVNSLFAYQMTSLWNIGRPLVNDGWGVVYKYAVSAPFTNFSSLPSTFVNGGGFSFNGGWVIEGYYGGTNAAPAVYIKFSS